MALGYGWMALLGLAVSACSIHTNGDSEAVRTQTRSSALAEPINTAPVTGKFYTGVTVAALEQIVATTNSRLLSIQVQQVSPLLLTAATVQSVGDDRKGSTFYVGITADQVTLLAKTQVTRIISLDAYVVGGVTYFAVVLLGNTGTDSKPSWGWDYGLSLGQIPGILAQRNSRLVDFRQYSNGGETLYAIVTIPNTGADLTGWTYYAGITIDQVTTNLKVNDAYLVSIQPAAADGSTFNVIMNQNPNPAVGWGWFPGYTPTQLQAALDTNGVRPVDVKSYSVNGSPVLVAIALHNTWTQAQQTRAACDASVIAGWRTTQPAVGLASPASAAKFDAQVQSFLTQFQIPGGAIAVVRNGKLVLARGYGMADVSDATIAHPDNLFRIASMSKQITSAAILRLVENCGTMNTPRLCLDDNPFEILTAPPNALTPNPPVTPPGPTTEGHKLNPWLPVITVRELLQHTEGWSIEGLGFDPMFHTGTIEQAQGITTPPSCNQVIQFMLTQNLYWTPPGSVFDYSNFGYCVLASVIEKVTGTTYGQWVNDNVLAHSGATAMRLGTTAGVADNEVSYYDAPGRALAPSVFDLAVSVPAPYGATYLEAMSGNGAWISSPVDIVRFQADIDGRLNPSAPLLSPARILDLTADPDVPAINATKTDAGTYLTTDGGAIQTNPPSSTNWYGLGWGIDSAGNWSHNGAILGTASEQIRWADGFGWAALFNSNVPTSPAAVTTNCPTGELYCRMTEAMETARAATTDWLDVDLFDQYAPYTAWMSAADYQTYTDNQLKNGFYPSRVEGTSQTGTAMFRAVFVPFHGAGMETHHGLDCATYQQVAARLGAQGYQTASLQSFVGDDGLRQYQATWVNWSACAPTCSDGAACSSNTDCASSVCTAGKCQAPVCAPLCPRGGLCGANADCTSGVCSGSVCQAPVCSPVCGPGIGCYTNGDCASGACAGGACQPPSCSPRCGQGAACGADGDCVSNLCVQGVCQAPACSPLCDNGTICTANGNCGSSVCTAGTCQPPSCSPRCNQNTACGANTDCGSGVCVGGLCQPPACSPSCGNGSACGVNTDCSSLVCTTAKCQPPSCSPRCNQGVACGTNTDCSSGVCVGGLCQPPACSPSCGNGSACGVNTDCSSLVCTTAKCHAPGCAPSCGSGLACGGNTDCKSKVCTAGKCR